MKTMAGKGMDKGSSPCNVNISCPLCRLDSCACHRREPNSTICLIIKKYASKGMRAGANPVFLYLFDFKLRVRSACRCKPCMLN